MGLPFLCRGSVVLTAAAASDMHRTVSEVEKALATHGPLQIERRGLEVKFVFGFMHLAPPRNVFARVDGGRIFADTTPSGMALSYELRLGTVAFWSAFFFVALGFLAFSGFLPLSSVLGRAGVGLVVPGAIALGMYIRTVSRFDSWLRGVLGGPPNRRLELAARGDQGMNHSSARRGLGAVR